MNEIQTNKISDILNELDNLDLSTLDCLEISKRLLLRNPKLVDKYTSIEDVIITLNQVILSELD